MYRDQIREGLYYTRYGTRVVLCTEEPGGDSYCTCLSENGENRFHVRQLQRRASKTDIENYVARLKEAIQEDVASIVATAATLCRRETMLHQLNRHLMEQGHARVGAT